MTKELLQKQRKKILLTASKVFAEKGYYNTRISDIAGQLSIGHGTIYRYFRNKQHIFAQLLGLIINGISDIVKLEDSAAAQSVHEYYGQMERIGWKIFEFFSENSELANIIFYFEAISISKKDKRLHKQIEAFTDLLEEYNANYLKNGTQKGFLRKDIAIKETSLAINAMIFEAIRRIFTTQRKEWKTSAQVWIKTIQELMIRGISV